MAGPHISLKRKATAISTSSPDERNFKSVAAQDVGRQLQDLAPHQVHNKRRTLKHVGIPKASAVTRAAYPYADDHVTLTHVQPSRQPQLQNGDITKFFSRPLLPTETSTTRVSKKVKTAPKRQPSVSEEDEDYDVTDSSDDALSRPTRPSKKTSQTKRSSTKARISATRAKREFHTLPNTGKKGLDLSLPPRSSVDDIFLELTQKALDNGLREVLGSCPPRKLRVATMCSGTESPVLALSQIRVALKQLTGSTFEFEHIFSAEIEPYKQAYIERNFHPPVIFRDVFEFVDAVEMDEPMATTAYGARVKIPDDIDILVAGTSCKDFSQLNNNQKALEDKGESGRTWEGVKAFSRKFRPAVIIFENVMHAPWNQMIAQYKDLQYESAGVLTDTKNFYLPQTRLRGYMVCFDKLTISSTDGLGQKWQDLMETFQRRASSSVADFLLPSSAVNTGHALRISEREHEIDWSQCAIRHLVYRRDERLGTARPFTHWQESGAISVPDYMSYKWLVRRSEREWDSFEVHMLRKAVHGEYDARYKTRIWDMSQNIDRFVDGCEFGITGCITPRGTFFVSDAGRPLSSEETLLLQGLPRHGISFTTELPAEVQNLAGNAMSMPVVGAALLAALTVTYDSMPLRDLRPNQDERFPSTLLDRAYDEHFVETKRPQNTHLNVNIREVLRMAKESTQVCKCEFLANTARNAVQKCEDCLHTACVSCGGNPVHNYVILNDPRSRPDALQQLVRSRFPLQLHLTCFSRMDLLLESSNLDSTMRSKYARAVQNALDKPFGFTGMTRTHFWTVSYSGSDSRLDLKLQDGKAEWLLYVHPARDLPCDHELRSVLNLPVARCVLADRLLDGEWHWRVPIREKLEVSLQSEGCQVATWWARLELPDYLQQTQPERIRVGITNGDERLLDDDICGIYQHLPNCETACDSLYSRQNDDGSEDKMFLFLDPSRLGKAEDDAFVFSRNKERLEYEEARRITASIDSKWRPWKMSKAAYATTAQIDGKWASVSMSLASYASQLPMRLIDISAVLQDESNSCDRALMLASCTVPDAEVENMSHQRKILDAADVRVCHEYAWCFEALRRELSTEWHTVDSAVFVPCTHCAPEKPAQRWKLHPDGKRIKNFEDTESATRYERLIKERPKAAFIEQHLNDDKSLVLAFGVNVISLAHRATAKLQTKACSVKWRLDTSSNFLPASTLPRFQLRACQNSTPLITDGRLASILFPNQKQALAWMQSQETQDGKLFFAEEAEEVVLPHIGWRLEARAQAEMHVRGGICADHAGFGKTITSLALVDAEFEAHGGSSTAVLQRQQIAVQQGKSVLFPSAATVVISPHHLVDQWIAETQEKLQYSASGEVISIKTAGQLSKWSLEAFQKARIIIVSRNVFGSDAYAKRLASFAGIPGPATTSGRAYRKWLDYAIQTVPEHITVLRSSGPNALAQHVREKYKERLSSEGFIGAVPSECLKSKGKARKDIIQTNTLQDPLFEMFEFNRLIVDEFHDMSAKDFAGVTVLKASRRWGLSATPRLNDFCDIAKMGRLLGIELPIGSHARSFMSPTNRKELRRELTDIEQFELLLTVPSNAVHARIHELDQTFLDNFVRRNVMDFGQFHTFESVVPTTLDLAHRSTYTEIAQQLNSQDMKIRRNKISRTTDRDLRYNEVVLGAASAEEALSMAASYFDGKATAGLSDMVNDRELEIGNAQKKLAKAMREAQAREPAEFKTWTDTIIGKDGFDDDGVSAKITQIFRGLDQHTKLATANHSDEETPTYTSEDDSEHDDGTKKKKSRRGLKSSKAGKSYYTSMVNDVSKELLLSTRSLRFVQRLERLVKRMGSLNPAYNCDNAGCKVPVNQPDAVAISAFCGHQICEDCFEGLEKSLRTRCPAAGCHSPMYSYHLLWSRNIGDLANLTCTSYGAKINQAMELLQRIRRQNDRAILFVQHVVEQGAVKKALENSGIEHLIVESVQDAGKQITQFQTNSKFTVIVLNAADETAAGSNLQCANHVIFLSPLLKDTQYGYESQMAQSIGRVRRHGQQKTIYVYRLVALHTIDVDILEHRERRSDAIGEPGAPEIKRPTKLRVTQDADLPPLERMQLVKVNGKYSLRPRSWLLGNGDGEPTNEGQKVMGKNRVLGYEDFSSLVKFSGTFTEDDD